MDFLSTMTWVDYVALAVMLASVVFGLMRGSVKELISLASWAVAFLLARYASPVVVPWLAHVISNETGRWVTVYVALFVIGLILMALLGHALTSLMAKAGLGPLNHLLGGLFGALRGYLILLVLAMLAGLSAIPKQEAWKKAYSTPALLWGYQVVTPYLPNAITQRIHF
jgi:membrane protein required for colicin V production